MDDNLMMASGTWRDRRGVSAEVPGPPERTAHGNDRPLLFMREVLKNPRAVGAIAPTSSKLARAMVDAAGIRSATAIIELGAGAGAVIARAHDMRRE